MSSKNSTLATVNELIAGSVGGAAQVLVGQPLDTVKTRAQIAPKGMFKGPMDILTQTIRKEGFFALYKGMASPLIGIAGVNSLLFASYGISKRIVSPFPQLSLPETALAGSMAGAANAILASPVEMFKVRMQGQYGGVTDKRLRTVAREMWSEWGFRKGVMRGYWVHFGRSCSIRILTSSATGNRAARDTSIRGVCNGLLTSLTDTHLALDSTQVKTNLAQRWKGGLIVVSRPAYEFSKRKFTSKYGKDLPVWALLASGSTGGVAYWLACYPLDVIKSRVQLRATPPTGTPLQYVAGEFRAILAESGA
ncbi:hypothetical protein AAF712_013237 [Marasmius tenuissimus]|uniref:Mitochondrial carrier n=1 Tax=Marasmius tenuissimus TaxID=585030 RepID=A0ABR2ZGB4_9AGAR